MRLFLILQIILLSFCFSNGQDSLDCKQILDKEIDLLNPDLSQSEIDNIRLFTLCYFDSVDVEILWNSPLLAAFVIKNVSSRENKFTTFNELLDFFTEFKTTAVYDEARKIHELTNMISDKKIDLQNWKEDSLIFSQLQLPKEDLLEIKSLLETNKYVHYTYRQFFTEYIINKEKSVNNSGLEPPTEEEVNQTLAEAKTPKSELVEYDDLLVRAKNEKKPLLIFFTGFGCINAIKMEESVLSNSKVKKMIQEHFIFVKLYVDDKTPLDEIITTDQGMKIKNIGNKNVHLQISKFQNNAQPFFAIVDENGNLITEVSYVQLKAFKKFLQKGIR